MIYGYCRISTPRQNIERQERNIKAAYPDAVLVSEAYTGTKIERPRWSRLLASVKAGDTIVFDRVSRMSRDASDGYAAYEDLYNRGVSLIFLKEPHINTANIPDVQKMKTQIFTEYLNAEAEIKRIRTYTSEGIKTAKLAGKQIGQPKGAKLVTEKSRAAKQVIRQHAKDFGGTLSDAEVIKLAGISRNSYYKYKRELRKEIA